MAKLGYTWYPKDWGNSEKVFELTLLERGLYRELIDMAMLNDNQTIINDKVWARKFGSTIEEIESILLTLERLELIEITNEFLFIPSCESRLALVRAGRKGGKKSKPNAKPISKPSVKPTEKPNTNQIETKKKRKEIENNKPTKVDSFDWDILLQFINDQTKRQFRTINKKVKQSFKARLSEGYSKRDIQNAIVNASNNTFHKESGRQHLTPEFFSRSTTLDKYSSEAIPVKEFDPNANPVN